MVTFVLLIILTVVNAQNYRESGFKRITVSCFDTLALSQNHETLIECCGFCMATPTCEGVRYDGTTCYTLTNLTTCCPTNVKEQKAWVETKIIVRLEEAKSSNSCK